MNKGVTFNMSVIKKIYVLHLGGAARCFWTVSVVFWGWERRFQDDKMGCFMIR